LAAAAGAAVAAGIAAVGKWISASQAAWDAMMAKVRSWPPEEQLKHWDHVLSTLPPAGSGMVGGGGFDALSHIRSKFEQERRDVMGKISKGAGAAGAGAGGWLALEAYVKAYGQSLADTIRINRQQRKGVWFAAIAVTLASAVRQGASSQKIEELLSDIPDAAPVLLTLKGHGTTKPTDPQTWLATEARNQEKRAQAKGTATGKTWYGPPPATWTAERAIKAIAAGKVPASVVKTLQKYGGGPALAIAVGKLGSAAVQDLAAKVPGISEALNLISDIPVVGDMLAGFGKEFLEQGKQALGEVVEEGVTYLAEEAKEAVSGLLDDIF